MIRKDTELGLAARQDDHRAFRQQLEDKRPLVEASLRSARQFVAGEPSGDLARNLRRELVKLSDKWNALFDRSDQLAARFEQNAAVSADLIFFTDLKLIFFLIFFLKKKLKQLTINLEEAVVAVGRLERATLSWSGPRSAAEARELLTSLRVLEQQLPPLQRVLDDARAQATMLGPALPQSSATQLEDCSARYRALQAAIRERRDVLTSSSQGRFLHKLIELKLKIKLKIN